MRTRTTPCDQALASRFLAGELSDRESREFETHLASCKRCQQRLAEETAPAEEWDELRESLRDSGDCNMPVTSRMPSEELEAYRRLLGPTDDPRMMGRIGTYEVTGVLGRGGMGIVFKALDPALNRYVAIKMLAPMFLSSGSSKQRFIREAQSAAAVVHEHVVGIHGISEWQGYPYLVMTYVRGESLQTRLSSRGYLSLREVLRIGMQIASGLAAAHGQGLMHRDIKPANILLESDVDRVIITDFGLARAIDDLRITGTNTLLGTPEYMSPEQARDETLDFRTDLFSLGIVLYEACTGRSPFRSTTSYGAIRKVNEHAPPSVRSLVPDLPEWFAAMIARLLQKEQSARFASASEVAELLKQCLAHVEQPHLAPLPKSLLPSRSRWFSSPTVRRIVMTAPWIVTALVGSWIVTAQIGQPEPRDKQTNVVSEKPDTRLAMNEQQEKPPEEKPTRIVVNEQQEKTPEEKPAAKQPVAKAGNYVLKVRKADAIDQTRLGIRPPKPGSMLKDMLNGTGQQQSTLKNFKKTEQSSNGGNSSSSSSGGFSSSSSFSGSVTQGGKMVRPNLAVAFEVESGDKAIFELENLKAVDDQGKAVEWMNNPMFNFFDPAFERNTRGTLLAYFQEENGSEHLKSVTGSLKVTPGRVFEVEFTGGKAGTKKVGDYSFTLKSVQDNGQGIQVSLVLPQINKPRGNMFGNPEARLKAMLSQQGALEVMLEDSEGVVHFPGASGGGNASGGGSGGGNVIINGIPQGNANAQAASESNFVFAALPGGREIKAVMVRATEQTGKPQSYPFKMDLIPIPYPGK